jgi:magnesium transporter
MLAARRRIAEAEADRRYDAATEVRRAMDVRVGAQGGAMTFKGPDLYSRRVALQPVAGGEAGDTPGITVPEEPAPPPVIRVLAFGPDGLAEETVAEPAGIEPLRARWPVVWVDVEGVGDAQTIVALGELFDLHLLALEDVVHTHQRPKMEEYGDHDFVVLRMPLLGEGLVIEQVSLFFGEGFVLTFQERKGDCLEPLRTRIREARGQVCSRGADYLAYAVIDSVVDSFFPVVERYSDLLEALEDEVLDRPDRSILARTRDLRHDLLELRRTIRPLRDVVAGLRREDHVHVGSETRLYLRDCEDHAARLFELVETYRDMSAGLMDIYLSAAGHRMAQVAQILTVLGAVLLPMTLVTGLYGMNFDRDAPWPMRELEWIHSYPLSLGLMVALTAGLLVLLWKKGWLGPR